MSSATLPEAKPSLLQRRVVEPLLAQLRQGATPRGLSAALATGAAVGVFPILGITTFLCLGIGVAARQNQPALHIANYLVYPLQIPLVFVFARLGETLLGRPHLSFSIASLMRAFRADPVAFFRTFGMTGAHAILGWSLIAPLGGLLLFFALQPLLMRLWRRV